VDKGGSRRGKFIAGEGVPYTPYNFAEERPVSLHLNTVGRNGPGREGKGRKS